MCTRTNNRAHPVHIVCALSPTYLTSLTTCITGQHGGPAESIAASSSSRLTGTPSKANEWRWKASRGMSVKSRLPSAESDGSDGGGRGSEVSAPTSSLPQSPRSPDARDRDGDNLSDSVRTPNGGRKTVAPPPGKPPSKEAWS